MAEIDAKKPTNEETAAAASLTPKPTSRPELIQAMIAMMTNASVDDLSKMLDASLAQIGHEADSIPPDAAAKNQASVAAGVRESIDEMFAGDELTEEFKGKAATLFEAHVAQRVVVERAKIEEEYEGKLKEGVREVTSSLTEAIDSYATLCAKTWIEENQVAIESTIRTELAEEFMDRLAQVMRESYIEIPDDKVDVVQKLAEKVQELEGNLDEALNQRMALEKQIEESTVAKTREGIVQEATEGLTGADAAKLHTLAEGLQFESEDSFKEKVSTLREQFGKSKTPEKKKLHLGESVVVVDEKRPEADKPAEKVLHEDVDPVQRAYAETLKRLSTYSAER